MHIVHAQPFNDRKNWFYENLYQGKPPSTELTLSSQQNALEIDRGENSKYSMDKEGFGIAWLRCSFYVDETGGVCNDMAVL